jgi:hypothetical protein
MSAGGAEEAGCAENNVRANPLSSQPPGGDAYRIRSLPGNQEAGRASHGPTDGTELLPLALAGQVHRSARLGTRMPTPQNESAWREGVTRRLPSFLLPPQSSSGPVACQSASATLRSGDGAVGFPEGENGWRPQSRRSSSARDTKSAVTTSGGNSRIRTCSSITSGLSQQNSAKCSSMWTIAGSFPYCG